MTGAKISKTSDEQDREQPLSTRGRHSLREAFGSFLSGVTVVTAVNSAGQPVGFTASSFTSVSLEPPLVLVCPANSLSSLSVFEECTHFAINILAEDQQDIANIFSSYKGDRFARIRWRADKAGCPILDDVVAWLSCATHQRIPAGDHQILIGQVDNFAVHGHAGLGYSAGGYFSLGLERQAAELPGTRKRVNVGAIIEHDHQVLMEQTTRGLRPPQISTGGTDNALTALHQHFDRAGLNPEFGPVYSLFRSHRTGTYSTYYRCLADSADTGGLGSYIPIDELSKHKFASQALASMMKRYALESHIGAFGSDVAVGPGGAHVFDGDDG